MSKGRDGQKGTPKKDSRDEPRHHGEGGQREDDRREDRISHEDREDASRTQRPEPRR